MNPVLMFSIVYWETSLDVGFVMCWLIFFGYHVSYERNIIATYSAKNMNEGMYFSNSLPASVTGLDAQKFSV